MTNHSGWTIAVINWGMNAWEFLNKMATFSTAVRHFARRSVFQKVRTLSLGSSSHTSVAVVGTTVLETQEPFVMFQMRSPCFPLKTYLPDAREKYFRRRCIYCNPGRISEPPCLFSFLPWFLWFCGFQVLRYIKGPLSEKCVACRAKTFVSPLSSPMWTFRADERLRLSDRNSILMT